MKVACVGDPDAIALAGLATTVDDAEVIATFEPGRLLILPSGEDEAEPRVVATAGSGLWRRAPWPVRDELFDLAPAPRDAPILVVGGEEARSEMVGELEGRFLEAVESTRLTRAALETANTVVLAGAPGDPLPPETMAVLAARRVLVAPRPEASFGLLDHVDHFAYSELKEAGSYADVSATFPEALEAIRAMARLAASPHRASDAYRRLGLDLLGDSAEPTRLRR